VSELLNPDDFVIVRRRKKYRFAKFANAKNCFEFEQWEKKKIDVVELGAGTAFFLVELARRYPEKTFAAVDVKADRLQRGAYEALEQNIDNIVFIKARADQIDELFESDSLESLWLTFADPFPRNRSARRRMTHPMFLKKYTALLKKSGSFYVKHDNPAFFTWSLEQLVAEKWHIRELSFDLHESELSSDYKIITSYEERWLGEGLKTNFVRATKQIN
jgi:tRNA (guanine-N7-)-methyltransferase